MGCLRASRAIVMQSVAEDEDEGSCGGCLEIPIIEWQFLKSPEAVEWDGNVSSAHAK